MALDWAQSIMLKMGKANTSPQKPLPGRFAIGPETVVFVVKIYDTGEAWIGNAFGSDLVKTEWLYENFDLFDGDFGELIKQIEIEFKVSFFAFTRRDQAAFEIIKWAWEHYKTINNA